MDSIFLSIKEHLFNLPGWHTAKKLVVFESDDWGSIRMPSRTVYQKLLARGISLNKHPYQRYDNLATKADLKALFDVLKGFRDSKGRHPVITANTIVANPDFKKIKDSNYREYHYELFTETLKHYPEEFSDSFAMWKEGIREGVFFPQYHGREHLNIKRWMAALQNDLGNVRYAFDLGVFDLSVYEYIHEESFMDALDISSREDLIEQEMQLADGLKVFNTIFGFPARTFIAPCYVWHNALEKVLFEHGVIGLQGGRVQKIPLPGNNIRYRKLRHYTGEHNNFGQIYLVRNANFEPAIFTKIDWISAVNRSADIAFRMKKPLIISTHRLNFIGSLDSSNRDRNLDSLNRLLKRLLDRHPEIEFMHSAQLTEEIRN